MFNSCFSCIFINVHLINIVTFTGIEENVSSRKCCFRWILIINVVLLCLQISSCLNLLVLQDTISVHRPSFYAQRFQSFFAQKVFKKIPSCKYEPVYLSVLHIFGTCVCLFAISRYFIEFSVFENI